MPPPPDLELLSREDRIVLAIQAIKSDALMSIRRAAATYNVPESTLRHRRAGRTSQRDLHSSQSRITKNEEEVIVQRIRKLDKRGFTPTFTYVRSMANQLLRAHGGGEVGINWVYQLIQRRSKIKSQVSRQRDHQRVLCSDPEVISP